MNETMFDLMQRGLIPPQWPGGAMPRGQMIVIRPPPRHAWKRPLLSGMRGFMDDLDPKTWVYGGVGAALAVGLALYVTRRK